ncbi:MAG TPA: PA2779 family protein [Steroidobacteraceae bacterium]
MSRRSIVYVLCLALLNLGSPLVARAEFVGTLQAVESSGTRAQDLATVTSTLARDQVRSEMVALGVDPSVVEARVARLTDSELRTLAERMDQMPAGGDALAVIGVVFLVLIILELVGVIDIFKKT